MGGEARLGRLPAVFVATLAISAAAGLPSGEVQASDAAAPPAASVWRAEIGDKRSTLTFARPGSSGPSFELRCENRSEHVAVTSRAFDSGQVKRDQRGGWDVPIELSSGPWSRRELLHHIPDDPGARQGADAWTAIGLDDLILLSFSRTGRLSQRSEPAVDLSARTPSDRQAIDRFFSTCASPELRGLDILKAASDARAALQRGDRRLLGVYGFALTVPGVDLDPDAVERRYGLRPIEGTSDFEDHELNATARIYAALYNQEVVRRTPR